MTVRWAAQVESLPLRSASGIFDGGGIASPLGTQRLSLRGGEAGQRVVWVIVE